MDENELLEEIITLLSAALSLAGVRDERMEEALDAYEALLDQKPDDANYDYKAVCAVILELKKTRKELFE